MHYFKQLNRNIWIITNNLYTIEQVSRVIHVLETPGKNKYLIIFSHGSGNRRGLKK